MQKRNFGYQWILRFFYFSVIAVCITIFPKMGTTQGGSGSVSASASAGQTGQNMFWTTYKTDAEVTVESAAVLDLGVYEMKVKVTGKNPKTTWHVGLGGGTTVPFESSAGCAFSDDLDDDNTYKRWGSGDHDISITASSEGDINGIKTSASGSCSAKYPDQP